MPERLSCNKWKQTQRCFFCDGAMTAVALKERIITQVQKLWAIGLEIKFVLCDQDTVNRFVSKLLCKSLENPSYVVGGELIYLFYDSPHLLKSTRGNFREYGIKVREHIVK